MYFPAVISSPTVTSASTNLQGVTVSSNNGRTAIVTGASKGLGAGIAKALAETGAAVVVNYRGDAKGAEHVVADITATGGRAIAVRADVAGSDDVRRLLDRKSVV